MRVEYSEQDNKSIKKQKKKKKRKLSATFFVFIVILVIGTVVTLSLTVFFNINSFQFEGESIYSAEELVRESGIISGENMFLTDLGDAEERIEKALPYVKKAEISRALPDKIKIKVTPAEQYGYIYVAEQYAIFDSDYKILEFSENIPENIIRFYNLDTENLVVCEKIKCKEDYQIDYVKELMSVLNDNQIHITHIDPINNSFVYENRLYVELGSNNVKQKVIHFVSMLPEIEPNASAVVMLNNWTEDNKKSSLVYRDISEFID